MKMELSKRLFVGNLPSGVTENEVQSAFEKFGRITSLEIKNKKASDGNIMSTFAFLDFVVSDDKLGKCLEKLDGSQMKGSQIRVQVAKENFLSKLQSERAQSSNSKSSAKKSPSHAAPPPQEPYNPLAMFKMGKARKLVNEDVKPAVKTNFEVDSEPETDPVPSKGGALKKLESFNGMWNDLDSAPVTIDCKAPVVQQPQVEEQPDIPIKKKKKKKDIAEEHTEAKSPAIVVSKKIENLKVEDPKKRELDNQKRLQSLQMRSETLKIQQNAIKNALSQTDQQKNRKIVFNLDDDEEPSSSLQSTNEVEEKRTKSKKKKSGMQLFDDEEEHEPDIEKDGKQFQLRPHLDGKTGQELLELQSRFAHDERFKLDKRFAEVEPAGTTFDGNQEDEEEYLEAAEETDRQLAILSSLVPLAPASANKKPKVIESTAFVRFDPTSKEHTRFEKAVTREEKSTEKPVKSEKLKKGRAATAEPVAEAPLPEVSAERYYTTTSNLKIGGSDSGGFSLRKLFETAAPEDEEKDDVEVPKDTSKSAETQEVDQVEVQRKEPAPVESHPTGYWKNVGMWHEPLFFVTDDSRLSEAMTFLQKKTDDIHYQDRSRWADERDRLIRFYRNKMRRLDSNLAGLKKRPLETADEADHFYSAQASAVSASKKPRKTFYHKKRSL